MPQLLVVHDAGFLHRDWYSPVFSRYLKWLVRQAARRRVNFITDSQTSRSEIRGLLPSSTPVAVVAIDSDQPPASSPPTDIVAPYVLFLGSLNPRKNPRGAIAGFQLFRAAGAGEARLVIAGGGKAIFREARLDAADTANIVARGYVSDGERWTLLHNARLLLFPSLLEGFGLPVLEAFKVGTPVVASDIPVIRELFGDAVEYVDPTSPEDIGRGIALVFSDEDRRRELIAAGRERAHCFSWERTARQYLNLIAQAGAS